MARQYTEQINTNSEQHSTHMPTLDSMSSKPCILLVEDNEDFRHFVARSLKDLYCIQQASNGQEALKVMEKENINIIISDIMMPVMDGLELCHQVKNDIRFSHIPIILLTAKPQKSIF